MKKSLISAVKKLLSKLGAEEIEGNNLVEVIDSGGSGSSSNPVVLEFATMDPYTVTTPIADIKTAIDTGRQVWFKNSGNIFPVTAFFVADDVLVYINFTLVSYSGSNITGIKRIIYDKNSGWGMTQ